MSCVPCLVSLSSITEFEDAQQRMPAWALSTFGYVSGSEKELQKRLEKLQGPSVNPLPPTNSFGGGAGTVHKEEILLQPL